MRFHRLVVLCLCVPGAFAGELFRDDFSRFPPRIFGEPLKQLNNALHEYHFLEHRGVPLAPWTNAMIHDDSWCGGDEDGKAYVEMHVVNPQAEEFNPTLLIGDPEWSNYTVEAKVRPLLNGDFAGVVFRLRTNRHYYLFSLHGGNKARLRLRLPFDLKMARAEWREIGAADFVYDPTRYYTLKVENDGPKMRASIDGKVLIEASDGEILKGQAGVTANIPARFTDFRAWAPDAEEKAIRGRIAAREAELARLRDGNAKPKLWKQFDTPGFGAGRNVRFGDLDGDGRLDMLIAQHVRKVERNQFDHITCLTAVNFDGKILWQVGRPDPYNDVLANDTPFQIYDIDGDGHEEVVVAKDFKLQILDGRTGKVKRWVWMPAAAEERNGRPYEMENGDNIYFINLDGSKQPRHILVKDRKRTFWVYDSELKLQWKGECNTGHYPYALDTDGDGRQELVIGYSMFGPDGTKLWSNDKKLKTHSDAVVLGNFTGDPKAPLRAYAFASDEGFVLSDLKGNILKRQRIGHTQSPTVGKFRTDLPGLQLMCVNFWRNPGIVTLFDPEGNILEQQQLINSGSPMLPVNWRGDGQEFVLLSGNVKAGGLIDGQLRRVVMFPDDGHPDLAAAVLNVTGDERDEIILWDAKRVWVYTQDRPFTGKRIYAPARSPEYNESNYRTSVSLPGWKERP